jgi:hypothetical protein
MISDVFWDLKEKMVLENTSPKKLLGQAAD